ncbi:MAG: hypothetical protein R2774_03080 [Saprospiraceae bacterium]
MDQDNEQRSPKQSLEEIQNKITQHEALAHDFEILLATLPKNLELPESMDFLSPKNMYMMILLQIVGLKMEKATILQTMESEESLAVQLAIAEKQEDYNLCIRLKNEIEKLKEHYHHDAK